MQHATYRRRIATVTQLILGGERAARLAKQTSTMKECDRPVPSFTFARGNATKLLSLPLYAFGRLASIVVRRRNDLWVFACGSGIGEGALELYRFAATADPSLRLVWLARNRAELAEAQRLGLTVALRSGWRGFRLTLRARVIVLTHGLGDANRFGTNGAFIVQLWHGIPLKKIQLDSATTFGGFAPKLLRALYRRSTTGIDLMPAASEVSAVRLRSAFGLPADRVVVTGDPRDDAVLRDAAEARNLLSRAIGELGTDGVVFYAPTWRDGRVAPSIPTDDEWARIATHLEATSQVLVVRPHPHSVGDYVSGAAVSPRIRMLPASAQNDINPVLPAVDILITDYSSTAFDFALLGRPIVFLAPDAESYANTRGLYEPYEQFSGATDVATWDRVISLLQDAATLSHLSEHAVRLAKTHHHFCDGRNTERLYEQLRSRLKGQA